MVTLHDYALFLNRAEKTKPLGNIVALQAQTNRLFEVLPIKQCNQNTREVIPLQGDLPEIAWRILNKGTTPTVTRFKSASYTCGGLENIFQIDEKLVELCGRDYVMAENQTHMAALGNKMAETFFYGDENKNPAGFSGLGAYYYDTSTPDWGGQIKSAGGTGDALTSLWFVGFSATSIYGICPPNIPTGFQHRYNGRVNVIVNDTEIKAHEYQYTWDLGLVVADYRKAARLKDIDTTALDASDAKAFTANMAETFAKIDPPTGEQATLVGFANKALMAYIIKTHALAGQGFVIDFKDFKGKPTLHYQGIPILLCDAISNSESA